LSEEDFEIFEEVDRRMRAIFEEAFGVGQASFFDIGTKSLKPLFRIDVTDDELVVIFDLPYVERADIEIDSTEDTLSIRAKTRKSVSIQIGGPFQRQVEFERYTKKIKLPVKVDPSGAETAFANGLLRITYPVAREGSSVRIR
jgi:HSP20 family molecular chaperone IbpA